MLHRSILYNSLFHHPVATIKYLRYYSFSFLIPILTNNSHFLSFVLVLFFAFIFCFSCNTIRTIIYTLELIYLYYSTCKNKQFIKQIVSCNMQIIKITVINLIGLGTEIFYNLPNERSYTFFFLLCSCRVASSIYMLFHNEY